MRHLLEVLCKDFKEPDKTANCITDLGRNEHSLLDAFHSHLGSADEHERTQESGDPFSYASLINRCDSPDYPSPLSASTPTRSPERSASPAQTIGQGGEDEEPERSLGSPQLSDRSSSHARGSVDGAHRDRANGAAAGEVASENHEVESASSDKGVQEELGGGDFERHRDKLEDLEAKLYEMHLEASSKSGHSSPGNHGKEHTASSVSDDDF